MAAPGGRGGPLGGPSPSGPPWERPPVASLNDCLTCPLCRGYLVDAMTLVKCLHSFCKSCILRHLETGSCCPVCELRLSKINIEVQLRKDEILQNIVYKAIPGLYQKEMKRRRDFYSSRSGKDERGTLTPEEKGELDTSSSGRVIFSPDEAVSLSLEYKHVVSSRLEGADSTPGTCNTAFKEPVKRYLNCPAAVTIALLQKFLRMKYGISSKYKVDIYYLDDILWSKYTLMDIAYIYRWKRGGASGERGRTIPWQDVPLQLFYRISENASRPTGPLPTGVSVTTAPGLTEGPPREGASQQQTQQQQPLRGDSSKGPAFLKDSVNFPGGSRSCKDACTKPEAAASVTKTPTTKTPTTREAPDAKPASTDGMREQAEPKVQSKVVVAPTPKPPSSKSDSEREVSTISAKVTTKTKTPAPVQAKNVTKPVPENRRQLAKTKPPCDPQCTVPKLPVHRARSASTEKPVSTATAKSGQDTACPPVQAVLTSATKRQQDAACPPTTAQSVPTSAAKHEQDSECPSPTVHSVSTGAAKHEQDAVCPPMIVVGEKEKSKASVASIRLKVPVDSLKSMKGSVDDNPLAQLPRLAAKTLEQTDKSEAFLQLGSANTASRTEECTAKVEAAIVVASHLPLPGFLPNGAAKDLLKALPEKLKAKGVPLELDPSSKKASLESLTAVDSGVQLKLVNHTTSPTIEEVVEAVTIISKPPNQPSIVTKPIPEPMKLQTCVSRAADKAQAKINALKAAASLKETSKSAGGEKDDNEVVGLSVTLRANRQGGKGQLDEPVEKSPDKAAPTTVSPPPVSACEKINDVPASETQATTPSAAVENSPVATAVPTYMTLSKSHPSLFHSSPRKRGRPRLATVNSLNEEIERAHMMAKRQQAGTEKPKPVIPVITSLRIKPIPPPPEATPAVDKVQIPTAAEVQESERQRRRGSQSEVSEEKSDAEDSSGRRKSRRRRAVGELKNMVTQLKELTLEKEQQAAAAATQGPLRNLSGGPLSPTPTAVMPEKITLRVTRDEKSNLKVEKQLRPVAVAIVTETLHDSGFCEDVVAEGSRSPALEARPKAENMPASKAVQQTALREKEPPVPSLRGASDVATHHGSNKKDMRKSKRRSVEDWVNEQSKWVCAHKAAAVGSGSNGSPSPKVGKEEDERLKQQPSSAAAAPSSHEKPPPKGQQRRGRKRTNPVKITKPDPVVDAQQEKAAGGSPPLANKALEKKGTAATTPPTVERADASEVLARSPGSGSSPREASKSRREPESPKKSSELVIPRYIPNPASSIPLTITHARNKRMRETDKAPESCLDLSTRSGDSQAEDSEKSKFFKEALNLSMKETGSGKGGQNQMVPAGETICTKQTNPSQGSTMAATCSPPCRPLPPTSPKRVTKLDSSSQRDGAASQMNILRLVEKIASQNSRRTQEGTGSTNPTKPAQAEKLLLTEKVTSKNCKSATSTAQQVSTASQDCIQVPPVEKHSSVQAHRVTSTKQLSISTAASTSEAPSRSAEPLTPTYLSPTEGSGAEIIPRINQTGVFRLEFPGTDAQDDKLPSPTSRTTNTTQGTESSSVGTELQTQRGVPVVCTSGSTISESVKNIARIQESIMGLQRQSAGKPGRRSEENHKGVALLSVSVNGERSSPPSGDTANAPSKAPKNLMKVPSCHSFTRNDDKTTSEAEHDTSSSSPSDSKDPAGVDGEKLRICDKRKEGLDQPAAADRLSCSPTKSASPVNSPTPTVAVSKTGALHPSRSLELLTQRLRMDLERTRKEKEKFQLKFGSSGCQRVSESRAHKPLDLPSVARNTNTDDCTLRGRSSTLPQVCVEKQLSMQIIPQQLVCNSVTVDRSCEAPIQHLPKPHQRVAELDVAQSRKSPTLEDSFIKCSRDMLKQSFSPELAASKTISKKDYFKSELSSLSLPDIAREDSLQSPDTSSEKKLPSSSFRSLVPQDFGHKETAPSMCPENPSRPTSAPVQVFSSPFHGKNNPQRRYSEDGSSETAPGKAFEKPCASSHTSEDRLELKPRERCRSEGQRISSSNEVFRSEATGSKEIPSPKASEHMYRTTVAEIDLFTTLTIIDTMKGRATVYDIIDDYITNLGSFFGSLEASPEATRRPIEEAFRPKKAVLLKLVGLLKKLTTNLSSSQLTRVLALEGLVERFLVRSDFNKECGTVTVVSEPGVSGTLHCGVESDSTTCGGAVLLAPQTTYAEDLGEPPLFSIPELEIPIVPILQREFSFSAIRRKKRVKRLRKRGWNTTGLSLLGRKQAATFALPQLAICRRFLSGWRSPALAGGSFYADQPRPSPSLCSVPLAVLDACGTTQELVALCRRPHQVPQLSTLVDTLSSLLTWSYLRLVNHAPPTNGQHHMSPIPATLLPPETVSNVLSTFHRRDLPAPNMQDTLLLMLSRLLCDHQRRGSGASRQQQPQQSLVPFQSHTNDPLASSARAGGPGLILVHAAADSSLVISSPQSNSKLVISPDLNQQLLTGLVNRLSSVPKTSAQVRHWLNDLASVASGARRNHPMLAAACHLEAPHQRIRGTSGNRAKLRPAGVDTVAMSRRFLRKRRVVDCGAPKQKKTKVCNFAKDNNSAGCSWGGHETEALAVVGADSPPAPVVPKGCVVLLQRLDLSDIEGASLKRRLRCRAARGSPKKKPKLSAFPVLPGASR